MKINDLGSVSGDNKNEGFSNVIVTTDDARNVELCDRYGMWLLRYWLTVAFQSQDYMKIN